MAQLGLEPVEVAPELEPQGRAVPMLAEPTLEAALEEAADRVQRPRAKVRPAAPARLMRLRGAITATFVRTRSGGADVLGRLRPALSSLCNLGEPTSRVCVGGLERGAVPRRQARDHADIDGIGLGD